MYRNAFPDLHITIEDQFAKGDKVVTRFTSRGTHQGEFEGITATGQRIAVEGISIDRMVDGTSAEAWTIVDTMGMMQQLGVISSPE
jgi:predicted ester cyclase